jgi:RimJ/RimL family protein N-acetyltransferase
MSTLPPDLNSTLPHKPVPALFHDLARDDVFQLETARLWLRWPRLSDAGEMTRQAGEKVVADMTAHIPHPYPLDAADRFIFSARKGNALGEHLSLAIAAKDRPHELIGMIGAMRSDAGEPSIGYWLGKDHWNNGYATEAAQAMIDAVFTLTGAHAIEAGARLINPASRRVLEKCGFRHEGAGLKPLPARGGVFPCDEFRLDRKTWAALRNWAALKSWSGEVAAEDASGRGKMPHLVIV